MYNSLCQEEHWDEHYSKKKYAILNYDGWLDKYLSLFQENYSFLDLGCGSGSDTAFLLDHGYDVISLDFSEKSLQILKKLVPDSNPVKADMSKELPFENDFFDVVIADLSLHYFDWITTKFIVSEIQRVLKAGGILAARFNSDKDYGYGAGTGQVIEEGYFLVNGRTKRFFNQNNIEELFESWNTITQHENVTDRYGKTKAYWEYVAYNGEK